MDELLHWWAIISLSLALGYVAIIILYSYGWEKLPEWKVPEDYSPSIQCSVIIPARNEFANLSACLKSIEDQHYPKSLTQVIVVDDHSTDNTLQIAKEFERENPEVEVLELKDHLLSTANVNSFKKEAIRVGIQHAKGSLIITTDADCVLQPEWLMLICSLYEERNPAFIAAPVGFKNERTLFERFQSLDFLGMMCGTAAGIHLGLKNMSNGANLAYTKEAFNKVGGFKEIDHLATGDDILLMQKIAKAYPGKMAFLKSSKAVSLTSAKATIREFIDQRVRWASKSTDYKEWTVTLILGWVFFFCIFIVATPFLWPFYGTSALGLFVALLGVKTLTDFFYLRMMAKFFRRQDLMKSYLPSQILHILYIVTVGIMGNLVRQYNWKGRKVR